jgi:hypothetical protein
MSNNIKSYFNIHVYNYPKEPEFYSLIRNHIKKCYTKRRSDIKFIDIGCNNGNVIRPRN